MQIEALQSMFPSVDPTVVAAVLETHTKNGSADSEAVMARATEDLLQLSDPEFTPEHPRTEHAIDPVRYFYYFSMYGVSDLPTSTSPIAHTIGT